MWRRRMEGWKESSSEASSASKSLVNKFPSGKLVQMAARMFSGEGVGKGGGGFTRDEDMRTDRGAKFHTER